MSVATTFSHTTTLTPTGLSWLQSKLAKWPAVQIEAERIVETDEDTGEERIRFRTKVSLNAPVIPGHKLLARLEHLDEGNIVYRCAGEEKTAYHTCKPWCDHCRTSRRRNDTFVLLEEATGKEKQVGRNCLAEYVRDEGAAESLLSWASCIDRIIRCSSEAEEGYGSGRVPEAYTLEFALSWALAFGGKWVSGSMARETGEPATAGYLLGLVGQLRFARASSTGREWLNSSEGKLAQSIEERAKALRDDPASDVYKTVAWIESLAAKPAESLSDYENNLVVLARVGYVTAKQWSFACSAFRAWLRAQHIARGEAEKAAREAAPVTGSYVGEVGKRMQVARCACVLVKSLGMSEGFGYGAAVERFLVKFVTPAGEDLTWFTSDVGSAWEAGKEYDIAFTPKKHEEYQKRRNTVVQRVAVFVPKVPKAKKVKK